MVSRQKGIILRKTEAIKISKTLHRNQAIATKTDRFWQKDKQHYPTHYVAYVIWTATRAVWKDVENINFSKCESSWHPCRTEPETRLLKYQPSSQSKLTQSSVLVKTGTGTRCVCVCVLLVKGIAVSVCWVCGRASMHASASPINGCFSGGSHLLYFFFMNLFVWGLEVKA